MKKGTIVGMSVILLGFLAASFSYGADPIKVGIVDTYTGPASVFTFDVLDGFKMAINKVNAKGGVLGKKI